MVRPKHLLDAAVEAFDHAVGLGVLRRGEAVFDAEVAAQLVERVLAGGRAPAQAEQTVCSVVPNRSASTEAGASLAWMAARTLGVVVACL